MVVWLFFCFACGSPPAGPATAPPVPPQPPVEPQLSLAAPWRLAWRDASTVMVQLGDSARGVRVDLPTAARVAGVTPIDAGRPWEVAGADGRTWPFVAVGYPDQPVSAVQVLAQGPDLVVRLSGPLLSTVSDHPAAPPDPVLTTVRARPRGDDWRLAISGLAIVSVPVDRPEPVRLDEGDLSLAARGGALVLGTSVSRWASGWEPATGRWFFSTTPALAAIEPYGRIHVTWTPHRP